MEKEKFYYIMCYEKVNDELKCYGYFEEIIITDIFQSHIEKNISTISDIKYAKKYKRKIWAEKMIQRIYEETKDNVFVFDDKGDYKYKFEIVEM